MPKKEAAASAKGDGGTRGRRHGEQNPTTKRVAPKAPTAVNQYGRLAYRHPDGIHIVCWCDAPGCLTWHYHGAAGGFVHRAAHCGAPGGGYHLIDAGDAPDWVVDDVKRHRPRGPDGDAHKRRRQRPRGPRWIPS